MTILAKVRRNDDVTKPQFKNDDMRWVAVSAKDVTADGHFFTGVLTTGIYCRPSCAARKPKRENIRFYTSGAAAEKDGLRACKRCQPDRPELWSQDQVKVTKACRFIEASEFEPSLHEIAETVGLSAHHFHRLFKKYTGLTPKQYAAAHKQNFVRKNLRNASSVTHALYEAGYGASSRFYEKADKFLGMTPQEFKKGGRGKTVIYSVERCSLGLMLVAATDRGICFIQFGDSSSELESNLKETFPLASRSKGNEQFAQWVQSALAMVDDGQGESITIPVDIQGTAFQQKVWHALQTIPSGEVVTYKQLAAHIKMPQAHRAVANACARNPVALVVPCHRVVRSNGSLSGYRWGVERKRALIDKEKASRAKR